MSRSTFIPASAGIVLGFLMIATAVEARQAGSAGGNGGIAFQLQCPNFSAMFAYTALADKALNTISATCADIRPDKTTTGARATGSVGLTGSDGLVRTCPANNVVTAMRVFVDKFQIVSKIDLTCTNLQTNAKSSLYGRTNGGPVSDQSFQCNSDEVAVGFYGRYGSMIDQIGLLCEKLVVVQPALAATKPPPAPPPPPALADSTAICNAHGERMIAMANELKSRQCSLGTLAAHLVKRDPARFASDCKLAKYRTKEGAAENIRLSETQLSTPLAQCKAGGGASGGDGAKITTILQDVDLYASAPPRYRKQTGNPLPNPLRKGTKVKLFECRVDDWCRVEGGWLTGEGFITK